jgi:hypothetical protein
MAVAYFMAHAPKSFFPTIKGGQLAILFCFVFLFFVFVGGGGVECGRTVGALARTLTLPMSTAASPLGVGTTIVGISVTASLRLLLVEVRYGCVE